MKRFSLRLPDDLHAWLEAEAEASRRSINDQLLYLVEQARKRAEKREKKPKEE